MKVFNLIFLGPQGSGKDTQARLLADKLNFVVIDAGSVLREIALSDTPLGRQIHETVNVEGRLVEPSLIAEVMKNRIKKLSPEQGLIIVGFPRTLEQYELVKNFWPKIGRGTYQVIFIELSGQEAVKRLSTRVVCELCGEIYVAGTVESCQKCGGNLIQREDDKPEAIKKRLELFNAETLPLIKQFETEGKLTRIDGAPSIEEVHQEIIKKLGLKG